VTRAELRKHRKRKDAWIALNGAVYNVTPYMDFHPGGWEELVQGAGRDATDMFNEIHRYSTAANRQKYPINGLIMTIVGG
jgi:cytochrome-b5 reductase